ncbi:MAG: nuclear transport factor 2 family protein [Acidobacteria bacterium]|nr:nuclear transport factor 2 family protein [Acidobacteriota bacterium]
MIRNILFTLTCLTGLAMTSFAASGDEAAVRAAVASFNKATLEGDGATLGRLLSEDLMYAHSNSKVENKAECIAALVKSKINFVVEDGLTVKVYGKSAMVYGKMVAHISPATKTPLHFMMMWVKDGNVWKMVGRHTARLP